MLALITRFAACCEDPTVSEEAFLRQQCDQIREYVTGVSEDQSQDRALQWIMDHAEDYRRKWHTNVVAQWLRGATRRPRPLRGEWHAEIRVVGGIS